MKSVKLVLTLSIISLLSIFNIAMSIDYESLFNEAYAIVGDDAESKIDRDAAIPVLIAAYASLTLVQAAEKEEEVESLDQAVQAQLAIVNPVGRTAQMKDRVAQVKTVYGAVLR